MHLDLVFSMSCVVVDSNLEWWEIFLITIGCVVAAVGGIIITIVGCRHYNGKKKQTANTSMSRDLFFVIELCDVLKLSRTAAAKRAELGSLLFKTT